MLRQCHSGWSHFIEILPIEDGHKRDFYAEMCRIERWSVRTLRQKIGGMLFERIALSKKPAKLAEQELAKLRSADLRSPDFVFRDPYFLDFLGLKVAHSEEDWETAILREIEAFLLELGGRFTFVARQMRMVIDGEDYTLDLLFYHRKLRRLIALEMNLGQIAKLPQAPRSSQPIPMIRWIRTIRPAPARRPDGPHPYLRPVAGGRISRRRPAAGRDPCPAAATLFR